jgi:O-antigen/teichoic acid export membrane protein
MKSRIKNYLNLSILGLDTDYFLKNGLIGIFQQGFGIICGFAVNYLLGNFVSKTVFGQYNLILSYISMFTFLSLPGIDTALVQSIGTNHDLALYQAAHKKFVFSLLGTITLLIISIYYFLHNNLMIGTGLLIAALLHPLLYTFNVYSGFLVAKKKFFVLANLSSLSSLLFTLLIAGSVFLLPTTVGLISGYLGGLIIPALISFMIVRKYIQYQRTDTDILSYGSFLTVMSILPWLSGSFGSVILENNLGPIALATFSVASNFLTDIQKSFMVFYKPITAKLAGQTVKQHRRTLRKHFGKFLVIGVLLSAFLWLVTPFFIKLVFPKYLEAIPYGQLLSLTLIPLPLTWVINDMLVYQKKKKIQFITSTFPQLMKIALYILLIPIWHIYGLIAVIIIDRWMSFLLPFFYLRKQKIEY